MIIMSSLMCLLLFVQVQTTQQTDHCSIGNTEISISTSYTLLYSGDDCTVSHDEMVEWSYVFNVEVTVWSIVATVVWKQWHSSVWGVGWKSVCTKLATMYVQISIESL